MKLSFLGRSYTHNFPPVEVIDTEETVTFLGQSAQVKRWTVAQHQHPLAELTFLGRRYTR